MVPRPDGPKRRAQRSGSRSTSRKPWWLPRTVGCEGGGMHRRPQEARRDQARSRWVCNSQLSQGSDLHSAHRRHHLRPRSRNVSAVATFLGPNLRKLGDDPFEANPLSRGPLSLSSCDGEYARKIGTELAHILKVPTVWPRDDQHFFRGTDVHLFCFKSRIPGSCLGRTEARNSAADAWDKASE